MKYIVVSAAIIDAMHIMYSDEETDDDATVHLLVTAYDQMCVACCTK